MKGLYRFREWWYYQPPQRDGIRPRKVALKTKNESEAACLAAQIKQKSDRSISPLKLPGEVLRYCKLKKGSGEWTRGTAQATESTLQQLLKFLRVETADRVTKAHLEDWRASMVSAGKSDSTVKTYLRRSQGFFSWLHESGRIPFNPTKGLKIGRIKASGEITHCTREQRDQLVNAAPNPDTLFVLMCGFYLGLRRREIVEAIPAWFKSPGLVTVTKTAHYVPKDKERRTIHYGSTFSNFLANREPVPSDAAFMLRPNKSHGRAIYRVETRKWIEEHGRNHGMPWFRHHTMRHTFATLHVQGGTPLPTVADWLGDSYQVTHEHYVAHVPSHAHVGNLD